MIIAWHIFFATYGTWLHGDARGSHDRDGGQKPDAHLEERRRNQLTRPPVTLTAEMRGIVDKTIREVCDYKGWNLSALNVRTNHVHVVVGAHAEWWKILKTMKAYAARALREAGLVAADGKVWTAKGGCKRIETEESLRTEIDYVLNRQ